RRARNAEATATRAAATAQKNADVQTARAAREGERADAEQQRAAAATVEAQRQQEISFASRLANESTAILRQQPHLVHRSTLLAVTAMERLSRLGARSLGVETALRDALAFVPLVERATPVPGSDDEAFSDDGRYLVVTQRKKAVYLCTTDDGECAELPGTTHVESSYLNELQFSSDSEAVMAMLMSGGGMYAAVWSTSKKKLIAPEIAFPEEVTSFSLGPGGRWLAAAMSKSISLVDLTNGAGTIRSLPYEDLGVGRWSANGQASFVTFAKDIVRVWS